MNHVVMCVWTFTSCCAHPSAPPSAQGTVAIRSVAIREGTRVGEHRRRAGDVKIIWTSGICELHFNEERDPSLGGCVKESREGVVIDLRKIT
mmetsp:Transcript_6202/g.6879  ORF Transcript_6202/g.6879 Transcript_6202/m.6879 type:complete len:92 (-) Transcript_6202:1382-1657(-)